MNTDATPEAGEAPAPPVWKTAFRQGAVAFTAAAAVLLAVYAALFFDFHPEFARFAARAAEPRVISGRAFVPKMIGEGRLATDAVEIRSFRDGEAVIAVNTLFQAEDYPFIAFNIEGLTTWANAYVFWRQASNPGTLHSHPLKNSRGGVTQIAMPSVLNYAGEINELAIGFFTDAAKRDNDGQVLRLTNVELRPFSATAVALQIAEDWTNPPLWQGYANNVVRGVPRNSMVHPNLVAILLTVTGTFLTGGWLLYRRARNKPTITRIRFAAVVICLCSYGWVFNDSLRWFWRIEQLLDTHERYAGLPLESRIRNNPIRCARREDCFDYLLPYF